MIKMTGEFAYLNYTPPPVKRIYTAADIFISFVSFALGYLFIKWVLDSTLGLGAFLFTVILIAVSMCYLAAKKIKLTLNSLIFISITLVFSSVFILSSNSFIKGLVIMYVILSSMYWFYFTCNNADECAVNDMFVFYFIKSVLIMPISCCFYIYEAFIKIFTRRKPSKKVGYIILGILCAVIPSIIIINLLMSADEMFNKMMQNITNWQLFSFADIGIDIFYFIVGIPVAMYVFGTLYSNSERMHGNFLSREMNEDITRKLKFTPQLIVYTAVTPICLIYVLFFVSQLPYFMSAFSNAIPMGFTYAEYARRGFFELCTVSVINACIIAFITVVTKDDSAKKFNVLKVYIIAIAVFTLLLIATALSKMFMYINAYGLTLLRVYTSWFMIFLACVFVVVILRQFINTKRFNFFLIVFIIFVILFSVLIFCDVDAIIAQYNIDNYHNGNLESIDYEMLVYELSDSAVEYVLPVIYESNLSYWFYNDEIRFIDFNFSTYKAMKLLKDTRF